MKLRGIALVVGLCSGLAMPVCAGADAQADRACARLIEAARAGQVASPGRRGDYVCERQREASERFVFALRRRADGLPAMGSNLVGYYLVDAANGEIHVWDLGEDRRGCAIGIGSRPGWQDECESPAVHKERTP